jgi:DNA polymerase III delta prime subunit
MTATQQKQSKVASKSQRSKANGHAVGEFPPTPDALPKVSLPKYKIAGPVQALLTDVNDETALADALPRIYNALTGKGMSKSQVASVIWSSDGIGKLIKAHGYPWLCADIERVLAEAQQRLADRNQTLFSRYIFIERQKRYWDRSERDFVDVDNLNLRLINDFGLDRDYSAHQHFHRHRAKYDNSVVADFTYWPGQNEIVTFQGTTRVNRWCPAAVEFAEGDISQWLSLAERLIPEKQEREHFFDLMAYVVQKPGLKPGHHLLLGGRPGIGKDTLLEPVFYAIGGGIPEEGTNIPAGRINIAYVKTAQIEKGWGYHLMSQVVNIGELKEVYSGERKRLANTMKDLLAAPPPAIPVELKNAHPFDVPNCHVVIGTTNFTNAIPLEEGERRWNCIWSYAPPMAAAESKELWSWYRNGGVQVVAGWLKRRDVSKFHASAPAPITAWLKTLIESGRTDTEAGFHHLINERAGPFSKDLVSPQHASEEINRDVEQGRRMGSPFGSSEAMPRKVIPGAVSTALTHAKWVGLGELDTGKPSEKKPRMRATLFASPEKAAEFLTMRNGKGGHRSVLETYFASRKPVP